MPKKVLIEDKVYYLIKDDDDKIVYSQSKEKNNWQAFIDYRINITRKLNEEVIILDDELEILEEECIIEELNPKDGYFKDGTDFVNILMWQKINEIVRVLNKNKGQVSVE